VRPSRPLAALAVIAAAGCAALDGLTGGSSDDTPPSAPAADASDEVTNVTDGNGGNDVAQNPEASALSYRDVVMSDAPLMYLRFGDAPGATKLKDETGRIQPSVIGMPVFGKPGAIARDLDTAVHLSNAGFDCGSAFDFTGVAPFTIEAWVDVPSPVAGTEAVQYLVRKDDIDAGPDALPPAYAVYFRASKWGFLRRSTDPFAESVFEEPRAAPIATGFHHYVVTYTGASVYMFADALVVGSSTNTAAGNLGPKAGDFYIGLRDLASGWLEATIDELAVYDKALTPARVAAHYQAGR